MSLAPYDVRQGGFTGAGVNAVTRSGQIKPKALFFLLEGIRDYVGTKAAGTNVVTNKFDVKQIGGRLGGALIKNKLFNFINYEQETRTDPAMSFIASRGGNSGSNVTRVLPTSMPCPLF